ncbi:LysR family transcriptional regulator, partial [Isoptericola sp. NPDC060185]|uniref:LysR family transcriptional regulator n=1 Tax=Isoptericola sp. NPDC060185 TaxID=3347065 RepID=UPI0036471E1A
MDVRHLALLRELADRGSVTAVAQATHRTPSAVSQQLRTTQRELRTPLVEPSGRGLRLTEAGRLLAEGGASVAAAVAQVQARWDEFQGEPSGTVSVAAGGPAPPVRLPPRKGRPPRPAH